MIPTNKFILYDEQMAKSISETGKSIIRNILNNLN